MLCWCKAEVDKHGTHLTIPEGNAPWSDSQFVLRDGYVTHIKGSPTHEPRKQVERPTDDQQSAD